MCFIVLIIRSKYLILAEMSILSSSYGTPIVNHWRNPWHPQLKRKVKFFFYMQSQLWCKISLSPSVFLLFSGFLCSHRGKNTKTECRWYVYCSLQADIYVLKCKTCHRGSLFPPPFRSPSVRIVVAFFKKITKKCKKYSAQTFFCDIHAASCDFFHNFAQ